MNRSVYRVLCSSLLVMAVSAAAATAQIETDFKVMNQKTKVVETVFATLVFEGRFARVWMDNRDATRLSSAANQTKLNTFYRALDTAVGPSKAPGLTPRDPNKGILENDIEVFGDIPTKFNDEGKTDFLLTDIQDPLTGSNILGYFSSNDQDDNPSSNKRNLLYIDSKEGLVGLTTLLSTIAHEFQHLIHFRRNVNRTGDPVADDLAFNEGFAEEASLVNGFFDRPNQVYLNNTNIPFFDWHYDDAGAQQVDYARALTFAHYVHEQFGDRFMFEMVNSTAKNMARVDAALATIGSPIRYVDVLKGFAVANLVQIHSDPRYGYKFRLSNNQANPTKAKVHRTYAGTEFPAADKMVLEKYGSAYVQYTNPGGLRVKVGAGALHRVLAVGYRGTAAEVLDLSNDVEYVIGQSGGAYDRVVLTLVNTSGANLEVNWTAESVTLGIEDEIAAGGRLELGPVALDALAETATAHYTTFTAGQVRLELFDATGRCVATPIAGERIETGTHEMRIATASLPSGFYMLRLSQGAYTVSRPVIIGR